jgi:hypothetical protein
MSINTTSLWFNTTVYYNFVIKSSESKTLYIAIINLTENWRGKIIVHTVEGS